MGVCAVPRELANGVPCDGAFVEGGGGGGEGGEDEEREGEEGGGKMHFDGVAGDLGLSFGILLGGLRDGRWELMASLIRWVRESLFISLRAGVVQSA